MPPILAFDTSGPHCAAAIYWQDGARAPVLAAEEMAKGQAERLLPMIEEMMLGERLTWSDFAAIGVGVGPGNFTGIRISVALARGLALGLDILAIGVTGFNARAQTVDLADFYVTIPAPRGQFYVQRFGNSSPAELREAPPQDAQVVHMETLPPAGLALAIAQIAATQMGQDNPRPAPFYLRPADAAPPSDPPPVILP